MTACERIVPLLSLYLEGETSPAEAAEIRGHLKSCGECRAEYSDLKATVELVRGLPQISAPDGFEAGVLARLRLAGVAEVGGRETLSDVGRPRVEELVPSGAGRGVVLEGEWGQEHWWDGWLPRFAAAAAAAAVVALSMIGTHELAQRHKSVQENLAANTTGASSGRVTPGIATGTAGAGSGPATAGQLSGLAGGAASTETASLDAGAARRNPQYDDLRSRFPDIPAEVIGAMPLNGETYAADRMVAQPWSSAAGGQLLAPVDYHGDEKVYIYR